MSSRTVLTDANIKVVETTASHHQSPHRFCALTGEADDLDAASAGFESTIRKLRGAAGFGDSPPWHDTALHPWAALLEKEAGVVQSELQAALGSDSGGAGGDAGGDAGGGGAWDGAEYKAIASAWRFQHLWQDGQWVAEATVQFPRTVALLHGQSARLAVLQLAPCASSGRSWQLWAARCFQEEAGPLSAQPLPWVLELAASKAADSTAFDHSGAAAAPRGRARAAAQPLAGEGDGLG